MSIEDNFFKKYKVIKEKLEPYGFIKEIDKYKFSKKFMENKFEALIYIDSNNKISGKVIDLEFNEEYTSFRIKDVEGEFVNLVKKEYMEILQNIADNCMEKQCFIFPQSNIICKYIKDEYGIDPEFMWNTNPGYGVFKNDNNKWFGIIMNIEKNKIISNCNNDEIEVLDLKLDDEVEQYLKIKGFYPAYHMNKKSWISIILDESVSTETIEKLVKISYNNLNDIMEKNIMNKKYYKEVYEYLTKIPKGKVVTYKQIAEYLGNEKLARLVGNILHKNPDGDKYPCFKVVNSQGKLTDAFAFNGKDEQKRRLEDDGVKVVDYKVDLNTYQWKEKVTS